MTTFPALEHLVEFVFLLSVFATVCGALIVVSSKRIIRSVAGLALCCVGLAGLYYFLRAPFLALMQILIYVGAVCVTIVFVVMLAGPDEPPEHRSRAAAVLWNVAALGCSAAAFFTVHKAVFTHSWPAPKGPVEPKNVAEIGAAFLGTHAFAFELISVVLVIAIVGALVVARLGRGKP